MKGCSSGMLRSYGFPNDVSFSLRASFFALRHGESTANVARIVSSDPRIATERHGLSELGQVQARNAGRAFELLARRRGWTRCLVVTSDFTRARETAECVVEALRNSETRALAENSELTIDLRLRERSFGEFEGKASHESYSKVWEKDREDASHTCYGVEPVVGVLRRGVDLVMELNQASGAAFDAIVLVAHGDTLQILQTAFCRLACRLHRSIPHLPNAILRELVCAPASPPSSVSPPCLLKRRLSSGYLMPLVGYGCSRLYGHLMSSIRHALDQGVRHYDCAKFYGNERAVGFALKVAMQEKRINRQELFLTSKLWNDDHDNVTGACRRSLNLLGVEYLDLYLIHWPVRWQAGSFAVPTSHLIPCLDDAFQDLLRTWKAMEDLVSAGLVRSIGVSNMTPRMLERLLPNVRILPAVNQVEIHPRFPQHDLVHYCRKRGIVCTAWSPLGRCHPSIVRCRPDSPLAAIAARHDDISSAQLALAWNLSRGVAVIPRSTSPGHIAENSPEQMVRILTLLQEEELIVVGQCLDQGFWGRSLPDFLGTFADPIPFPSRCLSLLVNLLSWTLFTFFIPRCLDLHIPQRSWTELVRWRGARGALGEAIRLGATWLALGIIIYSSSRKYFSSMDI